LRGAPPLNRATPQETRDFAAAVGDVTPRGVKVAAHFGVGYRLVERPLTILLRRWLR
jgi:hypothetical protein